MEPMVNIAFTMEELKELYDLFIASKTLSPYIKMKSNPYKDEGFLNMLIITAPYKIIKTYEDAMLAYTE